MIYSGDVQRIEPAPVAGPAPLDVAHLILAGFDRHYALFRYSAQRAKSLFESGDWHGMQRLSRERIESGLVGDQAMGPFGVQAAIQQQEAAQFGLGQPKQQFDLARHVETGQIALQEDALAGLAHHAGQIGRRRAMGDERGWGHGWPDKKNRRMNAGRGCYEGKPE